MDKLLAAVPEEKRKNLAGVMKVIGNFMSEEPKISEWKGFVFPPGFNARNVQFAYEEWDMPENSIFIHSFPKTGTNWTAEIIRHILYGQDENLLTTSKDIPLPFYTLELGPVEKYDLIEHLPLPRKFFVSHLSEEVFNYEKMKRKNGKAIYVLRNPKDQAVSWYHFTNKVQQQIKSKSSLPDLGGDWNTFFDNFMKGVHPTSSRRGEGYPEHIRSWLKRKDDENCLFVFYEDMKKDFPSEIRRIATFVNVELTEKRVAEVAERCSFTSMKKDLASDKLEVRKMIARKGEVGGWKSQFTVAQSERMDAYFEKVLGGSGIEFMYEL